MKTELAWQEWNFDKVEEYELPACRYWEYMRESTTIHTATQIVLKYADPKWNTLEGAAYERIKQNAEAWGAYSLLNCSKFYPGLYGIPLKTSWQSIDSNDRGVLVDFLSESVEAFVTISNPDIISFLYGEAKRVKTATKHISLSGHQQWDKLAETLAVRINWGDFDNAELVRNFRYWVKHNRPANIPEPARRGKNKQSEFRADLTRLAAMRLLSRFTPRELLGTNHVRVRNGRMIEGRIPASPECAMVLESNQFKGNQWLEAEKWRDARREARKCFRKLLPFLPDREEPLSYSIKRPPSK